MSEVAEGLDTIASKDVGICGKTVLCGTVTAAAFFASMAILSTSMIVIGSIYVDDCPAQRLIPVYLIVYGIFSLLLTKVRLYRRCDDATYINVDETDREFKRKQWLLLQCFLSLFLFFWFIAGCVWIFSTFKPEVSDKDSEKYCSPVLFYFAFVVNCFFFVVLTTLLVAIVFLACTILRAYTRTKTTVSFMATLMNYV